MIRQFLRHGLVYGGANVVSGLGTVALVPIYTAALAPNEYGVVEYVGVVQVLVQICAGLEITQAIARFYAGADSAEDRRAYASTGLWFLLGSFAVVCAAMYLAALTFDASLVGIGRGALLASALLSVYVRMLFYALQSQLRWELRPGLYSLASAVAVACSAASVAYLLLAEEAGVFGVFAGLSAGYGAGCAFCLISLRHTYRWMFDLPKLRRMLAFSLPLVLSSLAIFLASYGDRMILRSALGFHELGIYGIAWRVAAVMTIAINGFQLGTAPLVYRHHGEAGTPAAMAQLMRWFLVTALVGVVGLAAFSIDVVRIFASAQYAGAARLVPVLALAMVLGSLYVFLPGLAIRNMTARLSAINIVAAAFTLALIAALVRSFGMLGASLGTLGGAAAAFVLHAAASQRVYHIPFDWVRIAAGIAVASAAVAATSFEVPDASPPPLALRAAVFMTAAAALIAALSTRAERAFVQRTVASGAFLRRLRA